MKRLQPFEPSLEFTHCIFRQVFEWTTRALIIPNAAHGREFWERQPLVTLRLNAVVR
jgi:hypothetical protein